METGFKPFIPDDATSATVRPTRADPAPEFYLVYDPQRWDVLGDGVRPVLSRLPRIPGVNGVDIQRGRNGQPGKVVMGIARSEIAERGKKIIPFDAVPAKYAAPDGSRSYLRKPEGRPDLCLTIFETTYADEATVDSDQPAYHEWLDWLIANGHIPECPMHRLNALLSRKEESALRMADMAAKHPSYIPEHERAKAQVEVVKKAIAARAEKPTKATKAKASAFVPSEE
jgi:hypothetical protein